MRAPTPFIAVKTLTFLLASCVVFNAATVSRADENESDLIAVLASDAPEADKAIACKKLAIYGTDAAVPELAKLLPNPKLSSWARIPLEVIPGSAADEALREAAGKLDGLLRVGMINSIAVRRDAEAVGFLVKQLNNEDPQVAEAAAVALGKIGGDVSTAALLAALKAPNSVNVNFVAEGSILLAEQALASGDTARAYEIYELVRSAPVAEPRQVAATRGAIVAGGPEGVQLLVELLESPNEELRNIALMTARELPDSDIDRALADALPNLKAEVASQVIGAMADRPDTVILPALLTALQDGQPQVQAAAIRALSQAGNKSCLEPLLLLAVSEDGDLAPLVRETIAVLPDDEVDVEVLALLPKADDTTRLILLDTIARRRIAATDKLTPYIEHEPAPVRQAALLALGETIAQDELSLLVAHALEPKHAEDAAVARQSLRAASIRMPDREAAAAELTAAMSEAGSIEAKVALLETLGAMGGTKALETLHQAAKEKDAVLQEVATRVLGAWMTPDVAPVLLDLTQELPAGKYRVRALRGYLRVARQFRIPRAHRLEICEKALELADRDEERLLALETLTRSPHPRSLRAAASQLASDKLGAKASESVIKIAEQIAGEYPDAAADAAKQVLDAGGSDEVLAKARALAGQ
jgi:HEAT repeat protein